MSEVRSSSKLRWMAALGEPESDSDPNPVGRLVGRAVGYHQKLPTSIIATAKEDRAPPKRAEEVEEKYAFQLLLRGSKNLTKLIFLDAN